MEQVFEFFNQIFGTESWPPRWHCGTWSEFHGWLYIFSDILVWMAYFIIPVILIWFFQKSSMKSISPVFLLFGAFILLCGLTHLLDAIIFWVPVYRLAALVKAITAIVSMLTVFALLRQLNNYIEFTSGKERHDNVLNETIKQKDVQIEIMRKKIIELENKI